MKRLVAILLLLNCSGFAQTAQQNLRQQIGGIVANKQATVGVAMMSLETPSDTLTFNGQRHFPMQSVFKLHLAMAVLHRVDQGKMKLNEGVFVKKTEYWPNTWSPFRDLYPKADSTFALSQLIKYAVSKSDNITCDILFDRVGGPRAVDAYIKGLGMQDVNIAATEYQMQQAWNVQFSNWTTPWATVKLLRTLVQDKVLKQPTESFLWQTMVDTETGPQRLKGQLPAGTVVAHKTGTSGTNPEGITAAINDVGVVVLPNGKRYAVAVYVADSKESTKTNECIIADVNRAIWDYFVGKTH